MCGRYTYRLNWKEIHRLAELTTPPLKYEHRFNVAPTDRAPVIRQVDGQRRLDLLRWGLVPFWAADPRIGNRLINARSETAGSMPAFRAAYKSRRCLVPASGFYEWRKLENPKRKQPYYIHLQGDQPLFFAALWERWDHGQERLESYTILTTAANDLVRPLHDRMPVLVPPEDFTRWLDPATAAKQVKALLRPYPAEAMAAHPVSAKVNRPGVDEPGCVEPIVAEAEGGLLGAS